MNILSLKFLLFILVVFFVYWFSDKKLRKYVLLISSILFLLSYGTVETLLVIVYSLLTYYLSKICKNRNTLIITIIVLLIPLLISKYSDALYMLITGNEPGFSLSIIGISFLSFKAISYTVDTYRKNQEVSIMDFMIYMLFFPVFLSGPIETIAGFSEELNSDKKLKWDNFVGSLFLLFYGFFIKMAIADRLFGIINYIYQETDKYTIYTILAILAYSLYIYADFAGYSFIARGISRLFGIKINDNFRFPYYSSSIKEFWNRWHISLNQWLTKYIYIPLGGNRKGMIRKYINILIVFFISGLWHGTGFGFIVWGLSNALFQIIGDLTKNFKDRLYEKVRLNNTFIQKVIQTVGVYLLISFTWVFFSQGFTGAVRVFASLFKPGQFGVIDFMLDFCSSTETSKTELLVLVFCVAVMCAVDFLCRYEIIDLDRLLSFNVVYRFVALLILVLLVIAFGKYGNGLDMENFVYFKF